MHIEPGRFQAPSHARGSSAAAIPLLTRVEDKALSKGKTTRPPSPRQWRAATLAWILSGSGSRKPAFSFSRPSDPAWSDPPSCARLNNRQKFLRAKRNTPQGRLAEFPLPCLFGFRTVQRLAPALSRVVSRPQIEVERVVRIKASQVCARTRPPVLNGMLDDRREDRVHFDVGQRAHGLAFIHWTRVEPFVPEMAAHASLEIQDPGVIRLQAAHDMGDPVDVKWRQEDVDVVRHQAISCHPDLPALAEFEEHVQVALPVLLGEEHGLTVVSALCDVVKQAGHDQSVLS